MAYVLVGLGNPGKEYEKTRHNAGRAVAEAFAKAHDFPAFALKKNAEALVSEGVIAGEKVIIALPETMMNRSGRTAAALIKSVKAAGKLLVIHDELDLPLGALKMVFGRNSGGHKGVESIMRAIKTKDFARIRIGVSGAGKKNQAKKPSGEEKILKHVLGKFREAEEAVFKKAVKKAVLAASVFVEEGIEQATQVANTRS
ncbi:MAG: aminoacyl-tRNA hydrolase [Minisyncoccia bacterium]